MYVGITNLSDAPDPMTKESDVRSLVSELKLHKQGRSGHENETSEK